MKLSPEHKALYRAIDEILWNDWDPISMKLHKGPRDEYESYVPVIFSLKIRGANVESIAAKLHEIESKAMEMDGGHENCQRIAVKIFNLKD